MKVESTTVQNKFGNRLTFEFGPEKLFYSCRDANGERSPASGSASASR